MRALRVVPPLVTAQSCLTAALLLLIALATMTPRAGTAAAAPPAPTVVVVPVTTTTATTTTTTTTTIAPTTTSTTTTIPATTVPGLTPGYTYQPVEDGDAEDARLGWGTAQPNQMRATVHYGGSNEPLTPERRTLLGLQLAEARAAGLEIGTVREAERLGFVRNFHWIDGRGFDYINWDRFTTDLDLSRPSLLLAEGDDPDSRIISVAYNVLGSIEDGPPDDLPLEVIGWHYHSNLCQGRNTMVGSVEYDAHGRPYQDQIDRCVALGATFRPDLSHWMLDLWVLPGWENPWGLTSSKHPDMFEDPQAWFPYDRPATEVTTSAGVDGSTPAVPGPVEDDVRATSGSLTDGPMALLAGYGAFCELHAGAPAAAQGSP